MAVDRHLRRRRGDLVALAGGRRGRACWPTRGRRRPWSTRRARCSACSAPCACTAASPRRWTRTTIPTFQDRCCGGYGNLAATDERPGLAGVALRGQRPPAAVACSTRRRPGHRRPRRAIAPASRRRRRSRRASPSRSLPCEAGRTSCWRSHHRRRDPGAQRRCPARALRCRRGLEGRARRGRRRPRVGRMAHAATGASPRGAPTSARRVGARSSRSRPRAARARSGGSSRTRRPACSTSWRSSSVLRGSAARTPGSGAWHTQVRPGLTSPSTPTSVRAAGRRALPRARRRRSRGRRAGARRQPHAGDQRDGRASLAFSDAAPAGVRQATASRPGYVPATRSFRVR